MKKVTVAYDTGNKTWNAMYKDVCVFYGSADELDRWLDESTEYEEEV